MLTFIGLSLAVFVAAAVLDAVESFYVRAVGDLNPHRAAQMSIAMYAVGCIGFFAVLEYSWWLLIPECAGRYVGSFYAVAWHRRERGRASRGAAPEVVPSETSNLHATEDALLFTSSGVSN